MADSTVNTTSSTVQSTAQGTDSSADDNSGMKESEGQEAEQNRDGISEQTVQGSDETAKEECSPVDDAKLQDSSVKTSEFLSPFTIPAVSKCTKKADQNKRSPLSLAFRPKYSNPADIYKTPKIAAFIVDRPHSNSKSGNDKIKEPDLENQPDSSKTADNSTNPRPGKAAPAKFDYEEPHWGSEPLDDKYHFEVLKMGAIVDKMDLAKKGFFIVGRLNDCDIQMQHPSISRYHAVVQYGAPDQEAENVELQKDGTFGFYVYDLGSTHGTLINKTLIPPKVYFRIKVGHVVKFGGSTRMFVLQGPPEDEEEESKESATELRDYNKQKIKKRKDLEKVMLGEDSSSSDEEENKNVVKNTESSGVTWGMLEDAVRSVSDDEEEEEEEEAGDSLDMHPDAVRVLAKKEAFYVKDPMKALKVLYEQEKIELDFDCDERRSGHWHIKLWLPIDGPNGKPVYAEVNTSGKKKDAKEQCALEACRILERHGMFRRADRQRQRAKQWEQDDFYDSDEDEFHDRTGELAMKRSLRMNRIGKSKKATKAVETYESLSKKVSELDAEVKNIESQLQKDKEATKVTADTVDPLDAFMQKVKSGKALDTTTRAKLKRRLFEAKKEHARLLKLADLARPSSLPPLSSASTKTFSFIGKMKGGQKTRAMVRPITQPEVIDSKDDDSIIEEEDEEETNKRKHRGVELSDVKPSPAIQPPEIQPSPVLAGVAKEEENTLGVDQTVTDVSQCTPVVTDVTNGIVDGGQHQEVKTCSKDSKSPEKLVTRESKSPERHVGRARNRVMGPTLPDELRKKLMSEEDPNKKDSDEVPGTKKRKRPTRKPKPKDAKVIKPSVEKLDDPKYSSWLPPEDQSGDGRTSLNEKLGY